MSGSGTKELAALERDVDRLRMGSASDVSDARAELLGMEDVFDRVVLLGRWVVEFPRAASQLLRVISRDPSDSLELASTVIACDVLDHDDADDVLAAAFPGLQESLRDAAADRPGVRERLGIAEGVGYVSVPQPDPTWLWPKGKPFPSAETVAGVQARLNYLDLGAGPVNGEWTELARRAFVRWQVLNGFEPSGELDPDAIERLALRTPEAPD